MGTAPQAGVPQGERLASLDAMRGFTIVSMLLVNNKGSDEAFHHQFSHAGWGDFVTFCDMIFPWFLFMVGVALPWSVTSFFRKDNSWKSLYIKSAWRSIILISLGILIDCSVQKKIVVGMNVLQLIGLSFFVGILAYRLSVRPRLMLAGGMLLAYMGAILLIPIPGEGAGHFEQNLNVMQWLNGYLRPWHMAGILSVIPAGALVMLGSAAGEILRRETVAPLRRLRDLAIYGLVLTAVGLILHPVLEMNKFVWTPSYILFSGGLGALLLAAFYGIMDVRGWKLWAFPFVVFGVNAIAAYFASIMVRIHTVQEWMTTVNGEAMSIWQAMLVWWTDIAGPTVGAWLFTGAYIGFWFLILWWMHHRRIYWKV